MRAGSTKQGRAVKQQAEALTDDLAATPYESLEPGELDELMATLEPLAALLFRPPVDEAAPVLIATLSSGLPPTS